MGPGLAHQQVGGETGTLLLGACRSRLCLGGGATALAVGTPCRWHTLGGYPDINRRLSDPALPAGTASKAAYCINRVRDPVGIQFLTGIICSGFD